MNAQGASDLHMSTGVAPCLRINGDLESVKFQQLVNLVLDITVFAVLLDGIGVGDNKFSV